MLSQKSKIKNKNDKSKCKNLAFPFSVVARHDSAEAKISRLPRRPDESGLLAMTLPLVVARSGVTKQYRRGQGIATPRQVGARNDEKRGKK